jgi:hypothetical protein
MQQLSLKHWCTSTRLHLVIAEDSIILSHSNENHRPLTLLFFFQVDKFLEELSGMTKEDEQSYHFKQMAKL